MNTPQNTATVLMRATPIDLVSADVDPRVNSMYYTTGTEETPKTGYERPGCHICRSRVD